LQRWGKVKEIVQSELKLKVSKVDVSLRSVIYKKDRIPQNLGILAHFSSLKSLRCS
jgi:hypothetical protein